MRECEPSESVYRRTVRLPVSSRDVWDASDDRVVRRCSHLVSHLQPTASRYCQPPTLDVGVFHAKKGVLQSGNPGSKAGELGRLEPCMMVGDDVGVPQCLEQVDLAQYFQEIRRGLTDSYLFDSKTAYG